MPSIYVEFVEEFDELDDKNFVQKVQIERSGGSSREGYYLKIERGHCVDKEANVLIPFLRSKYFQERMPKKIEGLLLENLSLVGGWKILFEALAQNGKPALKKLQITNCNFTEEGASDLGWALDNGQSGFEIEQLQLFNLRGSNGWIDGLSSNTTIKLIGTSGLAWHAFSRIFDRSHLGQYEVMRHLDLWNGHGSRSSPSLVFYQTGKISFRDFDLEASSSLIERYVTCVGSLMELELSRCSLSRGGARALGRVLNTDVSGMNIETLSLSGIEGSDRSWIRGFHNNKSIKILRLSNFVFWHNALHFFQNGKAHKLESAVLDDLAEEKSGVPECTRKIRSPDGRTDAIEPYKNPFSLSIINRKRGSLSRHLCESIGKMLRSTHLKSLEMRELKKEHLGYNFLQDALLSQEISLHDSDFEPQVLASVANHGHLKRLSFCHYARSYDDSSDKHWESCFDKLMKDFDLTLLDEFKVGSEFPKKSIWSLCDHQLAQNKGPRKLTITASLDLEDLERLGTCSIENKIIKEMELKVLGSYDPPEVLEFLCSISKMPSLSLLNLSFQTVYRFFPNVVQRKKAYDALEKCKSLMLNQVLERNTFLDLSSWTILQETGFTSMLNRLWRSKVLLGYDTNKLPDGLWAHVFARNTKKKYLYVLFYLIRQLPRLSQQAIDKDKNEEPSFVVPHHPDCPGCHKRKRST